MERFNLSAFAVRERALTLFLILVVAIAGTVAFLRLGRAEDPSFTIKIMTATVLWPGATAQEMQDLVADPLEKRLQELRYYDRTETYTRPGVAQLQIWVKDDTPPAAVPEEFYQARKKMSDEARNLPRGVIGPFANDEYSDVSFALFSVQARGMPQRTLVRHADALRQRLLRVPGVQKVDLLGEQQERIFIDFDQAKIVTLGIDPRTVFASLREQNDVVAAGAIETKGPRMQMRIDGAYDDIQSLRDTPIAANGRVFHLSDIAEVRRGYEDPPSFVVRHDGSRSLLLGVVMRPRWNGLALGDALNAEADAIRETLPLGLEFTKVADQSMIISEAVNEFTVKFAVALAVVMIVSLIGLGWRVGLVVVAAVPLTLAAVFILMLETGRELDRITLGALILALGLLVDDAIIAIESMVVKIEEGWDRVRAASHAWTATAAPMLSGTLVTIIGLMPVGFAASSSGEYTANIFWVVGFALLMSWFVAVYFTPYLGVKMLPDIPPVVGGHDAIYNTPGYRKLRALAQWSVDRKGTVAIIVALAFAVTTAGMAIVPQQLFPSSERPEVLVEVHLPEGTAIETTEATTARIEGWLAKQPEAKSVTSYVGRGAARFILGLNPELPDPAFAKIVVLTPDVRAREALTQRLRRAVAQGLAPQARVRVTAILFGPPIPSPVVFRVMGPDADRLRTIAAQAEAIVRADPDVRQVNNDWGSDVPTVHIALDQARLRLLGLTPGLVSQQMQFLLSGTPVTQVRDGIRTADVVVRASGPHRFDPARLGDLTVVGANGQLVPLGQLGKIEIRNEAQILRRRDRVPTISIRADNADHVQASFVSARVEKALQPLIAQLPDGYRIETGGVAEETAKSQLALAQVFPVMLILMVTVIMLQVRSFALTAMVLLTAPLGIIGTVPILLLFGQPFGFNAILGLIGLAGILIRNTLILIGQIQSNRALGLSEHEAVVEAIVQRARPVVLTALAAVMAFIPLTTSSFWGPMAYTLIGGTAAGTAITLFFLPALYAIWTQMAQGAMLDNRSLSSGTRHP